MIDWSLVVIFFTEIRKICRIDGEKLSFEQKILIWKWKGKNCL